MGRSFLLAAVMGSMIGLSPATGAQPAQERRPRPAILVHDMPWFESGPISGHWGWHWTMNHFDPERVDGTGRRQVASHYYPLIGPYDSADPDVLEYHTLLMKVAGIDGVIADWYGNEHFNDYAAIHRRTSLLFESLGRRGLKFAVCYEDRVIRAMAERDKLTPAQAVEHGKGHLRSCEEGWFRDPHYLTLVGKPLLLVFGPDYLNSGQWEAIFAGMGRPPTFLTLHERRPPAAGSFAWPPMWAARDGTLDPKDLDAYLDRFVKQEGPKIPAAFPGFRDIYKEAGAQPSHGFLDDRDGETFRHTLTRALEAGSPIVQVVTWNDFGEGTCVEPTREYGYRYLEMIQDARRRGPGDPSPYRAEDLRLPLRIHQLRRRIARASDGGRALDEAVDAIHAAETARGLTRIEALEKQFPAR